MNLTIDYAFLPHTDPEASLGFYRDTLGLEVRNDVGYEGMRWITFGPAGGTGTAVVLHPPAVDPGVAEAERRTILELMAKGSYGALTLATPDLDGTLPRWRPPGSTSSRNRPTSPTACATAQSGTPPAT